MKYDAITLDTNILRKNGYNLETGLLGQLAQFKEGSVQLVFSEVVIKEVQRHLLLQNDENWPKLDRAIKDAHSSRLLPEDVQKKISEAIAAEPDPKISARNRLEKFISNTGALMIEAKNASIENLVKSYFDVLPPFEENGKKKNEFPDAIALLSLDEWAQKNYKKILAVSEDKGWIDYGANSAYIDVETDLSKAFQIFQQDVETAIKLISELLRAVSTGQNPDLFQQIEKLVQNEMSYLDPYIDADSYLSFDEEMLEFYCEDFEFIFDGKNYEFTSTQIGAGKIVVKIPLLMRIKAAANFDFYVYDSVDKDKVVMGGQAVETDDDLYTSALVTFEGNFASSPLDVSISELTLLERSPKINFGEVEPYREQEYEE